MNIVEIAQELREYLKFHNGSRRSMEALEESVELLKQDLPEERRKQEIERVGEMLTFQLDKEAEANAGLVINLEEKRHFADKIRGKLAQCREKCVSLAKQKAAEQTPLVKQLEEGFLVDMNAGLNGNKMGERENFSRLLRDCRNNISERIRPVISEFSRAVMAEFDFCMETIRRNFAETTISDYKVSYQEMNETVLANYDTMKKDILAVCDNYEYPAEQFEQLSKSMGEKTEKLVTRQRRMTGFIKLLPLILYVVNYLWDNYLFPKETWLDKLMTFLLELLEKAVDKDSEFFAALAGIILQFAKESIEVFSLTLEVLTLIIFAGWLYYIYIKIVGSVRKKSLYRKLQGVIAPEAETFIRKLDIQGELQREFVETENRVAESYLNKHRPLFEKLVQEEAAGSRKSTLKNLQKEYLKYLENGGK